MPTIPQRVASAFAVLCGHYGDVIGCLEQLRERLEHQRVVVGYDDGDHGSGTSSRTEAPLPDVDSMWSLPPA